MASSIEMMGYLSAQFTQKSTISFEESSRLSDFLKTYFFFSVS